VEHVLLGILAFLILPVFEFVSIKGMRGGKQIVSVLSLGLLGYAMRGVLLHPDRIAAPSWVQTLAWLLLIPSVMLLVFSLCIEIPFVQTYHSPGVGTRLVTTGTYGLTRHPGVLWFALAMVALTCVSRSRLMLLAAPLWTGADVLYAWVQDRYLFSAMFPGYEEYKRKVPMFVPTRASLRRCLRTLGGARGRAD
jgi:protein-S-isoprenylcysteine O-methyltransferase Ste14